MENSQEIRGSQVVQYWLRRPSPEQEEYVVQVEGLKVKEIVEAWPPSSPERQSHYKVILARQKSWDDLHGKRGYPDIELQPKRKKPEQEKPSRISIPSLYQRQTGSDVVLQKLEERLKCESNLGKHGEGARPKSGASQETADGNHANPSEISGAEDNDCPYGSDLKKSEARITLMNTRTTPEPSSRIAQYSGSRITKESVEDSDEWGSEITQTKVDKIFDGDFDTMSEDLVCEHQEGSEGKAEKNMFDLQEADGSEEYLIQKYKESSDRNAGLPEDEMNSKERETHIPKPTTSTHGLKSDKSLKQISSEKIGERQPLLPSPTEGEAIEDDVDADSSCNQPQSPVFFTEASGQSGFPGRISGGRDDDEQKLLLTNGNCQEEVSDDETNGTDEIYIETYSSCDSSKTLVKSDAYDEATKRRQFRHPLESSETNEASSSLHKGYSNSFHGFDSHQTWEKSYKEYVDLEVNDTVFIIEVVREREGTVTPQEKREDRLLNILEEYDNISLEDVPKESDKKEQCTIL